MSNGALVVKVGATTKDFRTDIEAARQDMVRLARSVMDTGAELASFRQKARETGGATQEQAVQIKKLESALKDFRRESRLAAEDYKLLSEVKAPDSQQLAARAARESQRREDLKISTEQNRLADERERAGIEGKGRANSGEGSGHGGNGNERMAGMEAGHSIRAIADSLGAGQNFGSALSMELPRLLQGAGAGIGGMIATEIGVAIGKAITTALTSAKLEREKFGLELAGDGGGVGTSGTSALKGRIDKLEKAFQDRLDATGNGAEGHDGNIFSFLGRKAQNAGRKMVDIHSQTVEQETDDKLVALDERRNLLAAEIVRRKGEEVEMAGRVFNEGEEATAVDRERLALAERIRAVQDDKSMPGDKQAEMIDLLKKESAVREEILQRARELRAIDAELRHGMLEDREHGKDTAVSRARREQRAAEERRDLLPGGSPEWKAADDDAKAKKLNAADAERADAEAIARRSLSTREAATSDASQKERIRLMGEQADLAAQLNPKSATYERDDEKRRELQSRQTGNAAQIRGLDISDAQRRVDERENIVQASSGRGPAAHVETLREEIGLLGERGKLITDQAKRENRGLGEDEKEKLTGYIAQAHKLREEIEGINEQEKERLATIQQQTAAIQSQGFELTAPQKKSAIAGSYQQQIAKANFENDPAVAAGLGRERDAAMFNADVDEEMMTPAQKQARARANTLRQQAAERVQNRQRHHAETNAANHSNFENYFYGADRHTIGGHAQPSRRPATGGEQPERRVSAADAVHTTAAKGGFKGDLAGVESLLSQMNEKLDYKGK